VTRPRIIFHACANRLAAILMKLLFGCVARVRVVRPESANRAGGFLLSSNHISHFDPLIISGLVRPKIDWMALAEFFSIPFLGHFRRAVDAFPAARDRADRATIRTAIERLKAGRIVGVFPEGGIRDGARSLLPLRRTPDLDRIRGVGPVLKPKAKHSFCLAPSMSILLSCAINFVTPACRTFGFRKRFAVSTPFRSSPLENLTSKNARSLTGRMIRLARQQLSR
jgi:1-acyl-sn-glycerol-3-phosphate acyltransferase